MRGTQKKGRIILCWCNFCFNILGVFIQKNMTIFSSNLTSCQRLYMWLVAIFHAHCQEHGKLRYVVGVI